MKKNSIEQRRNDVYKTVVENGESIQAAKEQYGISESTVYRDIRIQKKDLAIKEKDNEVFIRKSENFLLVEKLLIYKAEQRDYRKVIQRIPAELRIEFNSLSKEEQDYVRSRVPGLYL